MSFGIGGGGGTSIDQLIQSIFSQQSQSSQNSTGQSSTSQTGTTSGTSSGTSEGSTQRTLLPQQQAVVTPLSSIIKNLLTNPTQMFAPAQNQARNQVNDNYAGLSQSLMRQFMGGSNGASGKYGSAALNADLARRKALSDVDTSFQTQAAMAPLTAAGLAQNFLGLDFGSKTTGTTAGTTAQTQNGSSVTSTNENTTGTSATSGSNSQTVKGKTSRGTSWGFGI